MTDRKITILLFSSLRERTGTERLTVEIPEGGLATESVFDAVAALHPTIEPYRDYVRFAVNGSYASRTDRVAAGDTVAFITPVSGG
ncbi:MAG: MoaD/ThiS family protein [Bacteroidetes bacterium]|nr:MoaD/ThiS family protein [Bacteroidota bacterium]